MARQKIKSLDNNQLPREKAIAGGIKSLTDEELMAIIFGTGIQGKDVLALCRDIIGDNGGHLSRIARMDAHELMERYKGVGPAKALNLLAALEIGVRAGADARTIEDARITDSRTAFGQMKDVFYRLDHEEFWVLFLNRGNRMIKRFCVGRGGITATVVDSRIILREALLCKATGIILFHNHPSGNLTPSPQDTALTRKIKEGAALMDMLLPDHIIVCDDEYYSFSDSGTMP